MFHVSAAFFFLFASMIAVSSAAGAAIVRKADGKAAFALQWSEGEPVSWENLTFAVKVDGEWINASDIKDFAWRNEGNAYVLEIKKDDFRASLIIEEKAPALVLKASFEATGSHQLGGFKLLTAAGGNEAAMPLQDPQGMWTVYSDEFSALRMGNMARLNSDDELMQGCWFASVQNPRASMTFAFASLTAEQWPTWYHFNRTGNGGLDMVVRAGGENDKEQIEVPAGKRIESDAVMMGLWQNRRAQEVLLMLAAETGKNIKRAVPMRRPQKGWSTWHYFFRNIDEQKIVEQAKAVRERLFDHGYGIIQIDGGWWIHAGEFETDPAKFPNGFEGLSKAVRDLGMDFGVHMSPFRMDARSQWWEEHPDWGVKNAEGEKGSRIIDGSNPEAVKWLAERYAKLTADSDIVYYKFDFINQGAREGVRHNPQMTGLQSYNTLIRALREAIPQDVILNGCNALTLGAVECFDTLRVGPDINHGPSKGENGEFANMEWGDPNDFPGRGEGYKMTLMNQVRGVAREFFIQNNIAIADTDSAMVTPVYSLDEARCHFTLTALTGGTLFLGDRVDSLPQERIDLVTNPRVLAIWEEGRHAIPVDLFDGVQCPRIWKLELKERDVVAIFNWMDKETEQTYALEDLWLGGSQSYSIKDVWTEEAVKVSEGKLTLVQPPHSVKLLEFRK